MKQVSHINKKKRNISYKFKHKRIKKKVIVNENLFIYISKRKFCNNG